MSNCRSQPSRCCWLRCLILDVCPMRHGRRGASRRSEQCSEFYDEHSTSEIYKAGDMRCATHALFGTQEEAQDGPDRYSGIDASLVHRSVQSAVPTTVTSDGTTSAEDVTNHERKTRPFSSRRAGQRQHRHLKPRAPTDRTADFSQHKRSKCTQEK